MHNFGIKKYKRKIFFNHISEVKTIKIIINYIYYLETEHPYS